MPGDIEGQPASSFLCGLVVSVLVLGVPPLVGWAQSRHWLPHHEAATCREYQRGDPRCAVK